jgi:hypothetical protein
MMIKPGEEIHGNGGERLRVLDVVPFEETDKSPFVGLLKGRGLLRPLSHQQLSAN